MTDLNSGEAAGYSGVYIAASFLLPMVPRLHTVRIYIHIYDHLFLQVGNKLFAYTLAVCTQLRTCNNLFCMYVLYICINSFCV